MEILYFEDVRVGETITVGDYKLTQKEIISFATKWDPQPYHIDKKVAALSIYGGLTACGIHIMAIRTLLLHQMRPKPIILGSLGWDELRFPNPARAGDRLHLTIEFTYKRNWPRKPNRKKYNKGYEPGRLTCINPQRCCDGCKTKLKQRFLINLDSKSHSTLIFLFTGHPAESSWAII